MKPSYASVFIFWTFYWPLGCWVKIFTIHHQKDKYQHPQWSSHFPLKTISLLLSWKAETVGCTLSIIWGPYPSLSRTPCTSEIFFSWSGDEFKWSGACQTWLFLLTFQDWDFLILKHVHPSLNTLYYPTRYNGHGGAFFENHFSSLTNLKREA